MAILLAGAMIAGAIVYVSGRDARRVVTTTSAQTAWEYASAGWYCEGRKVDGTPLPLNVSVLETFAHAENSTGQEYGQPIRCTEP